MHTGVTPGVTHLPDTQTHRDSAALHGTEITHQETAALPRMDSVPTPQQDSDAQSQQDLAADAKAAEQHPITTVSTVVSEGGSGSEDQAVPSLLMVRSSLRIRQRTTTPFIATFTKKKRTAAQK